jgi:hypothetical protein
MSNSSVATIKILGLEHELRRLCYNCLTEGGSFNSRFTDALKYEYSILDKELTFGYFKSGTVKEVELKCMTMFRNKKYYLGANQIKDILSYLVMNNLSQFSVSNLLKYEIFFSSCIHDEAYNKIKLVEKLMK